MRLNKSILSIIIKSYGVLAGLLFTVIVARILGPEQYGVFAFALAVISILTIPAVFGMPALIVRETAKYEIRKDYESIKGLWYWSSRLTLKISLIIVFFVAAYYYFKIGVFNSEKNEALILGVLSIPIIAMLALKNAALRGLRKVILGQLPEQVIKPSVMLVIVSLSIFVGMDNLASFDAMMLYVAGVSIALIASSRMLSKKKPMEINSVEKRIENKAWLKSVVPLAVVGGLDLILHQTDIVMLGIMSDADQVGVYKIAVQGAALTIIATETLKLISAPYFARYYDKGEMDKFQKLAVSNARLGILIALPAAFIFIFLGEMLILKVFGDVYKAAYGPLVILVIGQVIHVAIGVGGPLLNACGYERKTLIAQIFSAITNIILNIVFIPIWGIEGAAWATFIAILVRKILIWLMTIYYLRIDTSIFGVKFNSGKHNNES